MAMTHGMLPLMPKQQSRSASIAKAKKDSLDRTRSEQNVATVLLGSADGLIFRNKREIHKSSDFRFGTRNHFHWIQQCVGYSRYTYLCLIMQETIASINGSLISVFSNISRLRDAIIKTMASKFCSA